MNNIILNIGLDGAPVPESYTNGKRNPAETSAAMNAILVLREHGIIATQLLGAQSDTELTAVIRCWAKDNLDFGHAVYAVALNQEAIGVYWEDTGTGALIGPRAAEWGPFDPTRFITTTGQRLA